MKWTLVYRDRLDEAALQVCWTRFSLASAVLLAAYRFHIEPRIFDPLPSGWVQMIPRA